MRTRWITVALLVLLAALWATWPDAPLAWLAVLALAAPVALLLRPHPVLGIVALAAVASATTLLPAGLFEWRPWASGALLVGLLAASLAPSRLALAPPRASLLVVAAGLAALVVLLRVWTPTRDVLAGRAGVVAAVMTLGAAGLALVIVLASEEESAKAGEP